MRRLAPFIRRFLRHRSRLLLGILAIPMVALCDIQLTLFIGDTLNELRAGTDTAFLAGVFGAMLAISATQGLFRFLQRWWIVGVSRRVEVELKQELFEKLCQLPLGFHARTRSGDIVSRLTSDVENIRMLLGPGSMYVFSAIFLVPSSLYVLFQISPRITVTMAIPLLLVAVAMKALTPRLHRASVAVQESLADINHRAQESFGGIRVVRGYGLAQHEQNGFAAVSEENRSHQIRMATERGLMHGLVNLAYDLAFLPVLLVGGLAMIDRTIAVGDLFKFIDLGFKVFWPVIALGWIAGMYPRAVASAERIDELLDEEPDIADPEHPIELDVAGAFSLRNVSYMYEGAPRESLAGLNIEVPAGTTLGVVGPTGSGKSTLLNLLGRLFEARGDIRLDGVPLSRLKLETLRGALAYVPQDSFLFSDTFRNNIAFGADGDVDEADLRGWIDRAAMTQEVARFPNGLDQVIGERGVTLSGGQRQRACIARALARNPRVLILDDALSAVDTETESLLLDGLRVAGAGRTVVIAAHRLGSVRNAENTVVLRDGRIEAQGTHEELLERSDWYRATWARQQMEEELEELS